MISSPFSSIFLLAHCIMGKLPVSLIIKAFLVLGRSPEVPLEQKPCNNSRGQTDSEGNEESTNVKYSKPDSHCVIITAFELQEKMC